MNGGIYNMRRLPIRRSQLVGMAGPGSLVVSPEGETAIVGALDYWFTKNSLEETNRSEFEIIEPRLKNFMGVKKLYTPPDYRKSIENEGNVNITIPLLRFPNWHFCPFCKTMNKLNYNSESSRKYCETCESTKEMKQVPFIVACKKGHISDFAWHEWVHRGEKCGGKITIKSSGGATLDSWSISCSCGSKRSLKGITGSLADGSFITENLYSDQRKFYCSGHKAWCGDEYEECNEPVVAVLRNSINVYMPQVVSVISLPGERNYNMDKIISFLEKQRVVHSMLENKETEKEKVAFLFSAVNQVLDVNLKDCEQTIQYMYGSDNKGKIENNNPLTLREKEFEVLSSNFDESYLKVVEEWNSNQTDAENYAGKYTSYIKKINRVTKLRETKVLGGFKRLNSTDEDGSYTYKSDFDLMYHKKIEDSEKWLPAHSVFGEGIFIQFDDERIREWEENPLVVEHFKKYLKRIEKMAHIMPEIIKFPRNIMIHTLSHFIMEEIANTSGYNLASIRERLYVEENQAGILIYTSAGDIEGTFGGLVRLGRKNQVFHLIDKAISKSTWCSSDPVCTELGESIGQGVFGSNGASCYNCSYIPETSCECGNRYLDRSLLSGEKFGFFK